MPSDTHAPARPASTRDRILEAAWPPCGTRIAGISARIARHGGFNQALIFYHFGSVDALLVAVARSESERLLDFYAEALREVDSLVGLVAVARRLHDEEFQAGTVAALTQMLAGAVGGAALAQGIRDAFEPWTAGGRDHRPAARRHALCRRAAGRRPHHRGTALFLGIELLVGVDPDAAAGDGLFGTMESVAWLVDAPAWPGAPDPTVGWPDGRHPPAGSPSTSCPPTSAPRTTSSAT